MQEKYEATRTFDSDTALAILGVPGRLKQRSVCSATKVGCWEHQTWVSKRRTKVVDGDTIIMNAEIRFDDNCHNGHNSFAITGHGWYGRYNSRDWDFGGCCHEKIEEVFPELAGIIQWHLVSTNSPMHYVANTVHHASNRDCWGKLKGEPKSWERRLYFGNSPIAVKVESKFLDWIEEVQKHRASTLKTNPHRRNYEIVEVPYVCRPGSQDYKFSPKYTFDDYGMEDPAKGWYNAPFNSEREANEFRAAVLGGYRVEKVATAWGEGKERDFAAARASACWPEATDEQLSLPEAELTALLEARLPGMIEEFRAAMASLGLFWSPEEYEEAKGKA